MTYDPFDATMHQILEAEREMRNLAEQQAVECRKLLFELAVRFSPERIEEMKKRNPLGWREEMTPENMARLVVEGASRVRWGNLQSGREKELLGEVESLKEENARLKLALDRAVRTERPGVAREKIEVVERRTSKLAIPPLPPVRYRDLFQNWRREGTVIAALAQYGWSMRLSLAEAVVGVDENLSSANAGSVRRMLRKMENLGILGSEVVKLGKASATMVWLTEKGKEIARAMGIEPVESEWERLMRLHGGEAQSKHAGLVCAFTYHARKRGWKTEVCPAVEGPADPDVLIEKDGRRMYVEVEGESGDAGRRMKKWRNMADLQGFVALVATSRPARRRLVAEAKGASRRGFAADLQSLIQDFSGDLWAESW